VAAFICAFALSMTFALGEWLERFAESLGHRRWISFAAGVSTAYVFVDVLPELSERNQVVVQIEGGHLLFGEQRIFGLALFAFVLLYGLDHLVSTKTREPSESASQGAPAFDFVDWLQVAGFAIYSWMIGYLLVERVEKGTLSLGLYVVAMSLHFLIVDHSLQEKRGRSYRRFGRWVLAASVPLGCLAGSVSPISEVTFARLFAFIAGGMIMTSAQAELPKEREGRFWPFCLGAILYAVLLLAN
jgi:hypothetical protein